MRRLTRMSAIAVVGGAALVVLAPGTASAHPLGNFTVNRYTGLVVSPEAVSIDHVLDMAEIPTAQRRPEVDTSGDGRLSRTELARWARGACTDAADALRLTVGDGEVPLSVRSSSARSTAGQAGLPVLRLECALRGETGRLTMPTTIRLVDTAAGRELGWREITARGDGTTLTRSDVLGRSSSARLTSYPRDLLASPLDLRSARLGVRPGGALLRQDERGGDTPADGAGADRLTRAFEGLVRWSDGGPLLSLVGLLGAVAFGATHALAPGHGKTIMAFYLSGHRTRAVRAAVTVGATVTATHTAGVLVLGLLVSAGTAVAPASAYPWLSVASGVLVVAVGLTLLRAVRRGGHAHAHGTGPGQHTHDHAHHDHDDRHEEPPPSGRGLVALGVAGGLVPSPSALLVLLAAVALGRPWFGVGLVLAFGLGMAATLATTGLLVMRMRTRAEHRLARRPASRFAFLVHAAPLVTACAVSLLGAALALRGLGDAGVL